MKRLFFQEAYNQALKSEMNFNHGAVLIHRGKIIGRGYNTYYNTYKDFKVGNFQQLYPFHYVEKDWMSISMIKQMEKEYGIA